MLCACAMQMLLCTCAEKVRDYLAVREVCVDHEADDGVHVPKLLLQVVDVALEPADAEVRAHSGLARGCRR
eukprot:6213314-Pleurochrysis_carterae.AAC.5